MASVERQLRASQKFLAGLTKLPMYGQARQKQNEMILKSLRSVKEINTSAAASLISSLQEDLWDPESLLSIKTAISEKTDAAEVSQQRRQQQDFLELPRYLTEEMWRQLLEPNTSPAASVERICAHAYALGLRLPSEMTVAMIIALAYQTKVPGMTGHEKFKLLEKNKPVIKKILSGSAPRVFLTTLPAALEDFPRELNEVAFPAGTAPAPQPLHMDFGRVARSWPMRWSNRLAAAGSTPGVLDRPDHSAQEATLSRLAEAVASTGQLAVQAVATKQAATDRRPSNVSTQSDLGPALALEDMDRTAGAGAGALEDIAPEVQEAKVSTNVPTAALSAVEQQLLDLQNSVRPVLKRPSGALKEEPPAAKSGSGKTLKKPAAQQAKEKPRPKRGVLAKPAAALDRRGQGPDTKKRFASRAYFKARRQALSQNKGDEEALKLARKAHRQASTQWDRLRAV